DGFVRRAGTRIDDDGLLADRSAGGLEPLFPLSGALRLAVSGQQEIPALRAASMLRPEQTQTGAVQGRLVPAAPCGPVLGQGRVVRGRRAWNQLVPDDLRPAELGQVGAGFPVAGHPSVLPGLVERAVVPGGDSALRLVRVAVPGPLVG